MHNEKYLFITLFLSCMVICLSAARLQADGTCSDTTAESTDATKEEILSEFDQTKGLFPGDNFYLGDLPSQMDSNLHQSGKKDPDAAGKLPDTSKKPETVSNFETAVKPRRTPYALEGGPASEAYKKAVHHALWVIGTYNKMLDAEEKAKEAAEELGKAVNDTIDAKPGEEAKKAAKKVEDAAKEAERTAKEAKDAKKEYEEAEEEYEKASEEYKKATNKAYEEAEKQNEAAQEAAEKAYEATKHGNKK